MSRRRKASMGYTKEIILGGGGRGGEDKIMFCESKSKIVGTTFTKRRKKERDREREKQRERNRDRQTDRQTGR